MAKRTSQKAKERESPYDYIFAGKTERMKNARPGIVLGKTALLIIDMQYLCASPDSGWARILKDKGKPHLAACFFNRLKDTVVPNIQRLQETCRETGIDVIFVKIACQKPDGSDASPKYRLLPIYARPGSKDAQILEEIAPRPGEIVISKASTGAFNSTHIDYVLHRLGIEILIVTGVNTNACVEMTSKDAEDRGYWVYLVEDACAALAGEETHKSTIKRLDSGDLLKVVQTAEVLKMLNRP